jgi:hypothetical protein
MVLHAHIHVVSGDKGRASLHYRVYDNSDGSYQLAPCSPVARSRSPVLEEMLQLADSGNSVELPVEHHAFLAWHTFVTESTLLQEPSLHFSSLCDIAQVSPARSGIFQLVFANCCTNPSCLFQDFPTCTQTVAPTCNGYDFCITVELHLAYQITAIHSSKTQFVLKKTTQ